MHLYEMVNSFYTSHSGKSSAMLLLIYIASPIAKSIAKSMVKPLKPTKRKYGLGLSCAILSMISDLSVCL